MAPSTSQNRWRWLAVAAMMCITVLFGTDLFSSENTRPIFRWIMRLLFGESADVQVVGSGEGLLRKSAHFLEYALLAWLWLRALRGDQPWQWQWVAIALAATVLWATVDELQQGFISTQRTGSPWDVLLDSCGALTALILVVLVHLFKKARNQPADP